MDYQSIDPPSKIKRAVSNVTPPFQNSANLSDVEKKISQNLFTIRQKCKDGLSLMNELLSNSSSKLTVSISCFLAKKVNAYLEQITDLSERLGKMSEYENIKPGGSGIPTTASILSILKN